MARPLTTKDRIDFETQTFVSASSFVRRLTPMECERLMGWPDDWTRYRPDGSGISDSVRYRLIGNGVVAPVSAWIARRLMAAHNSTVPGQDGAASSVSTHDNKEPRRG